ncbi:M42 family metallopeptidase [Mesomycoplasma molare]|uniref:M42 family metallopeptidase n=1 Tax=Mesomycoplasma molare TaxID=171288 RepID=A0ABY5TUV7_9BACT|nr:M42 family metallopeptidase [Mesomycoplasma molare]UWD34445.1 M42 family metallopeptidase [Mesomycoplasma molare]
MERDKKYTELVFSRLKEYMEIEGVSRYEDNVVEALKNNTKDANVEYSRDRFGSLIMTKKGHTSGPKIMLAAHMDEVGYAVLDILDNGQIKVSPIGGLWPTVVVGTKAKLIASSGKEFYGIFGHTSIHIMEREKISKAMTTKDLFVDFGFKDKKEAEEQGIEPGDRILMHGETFRLYNSDLVAGKSMDNRAGVTVLDQIINRLKDQKLPNRPYFVGTVQEEVGTRGAKTSVSLIEPDIAFAIDTGASHDTDGAIKGDPKLGLGVAINIQDYETMMDPKLVKILTDIAKKHNIPVYKYVAQGGGTDAAELQYGKGGVPTISLSIPQRYLHSPLGVASLFDMEALINLMVEFLKAFDQKTFESIQYK